jgi:diaminopimelate epimerase
MISFTKMHGLGNDFVVLDLRDGTAAPGADAARAIADRRRGVGCDQIILIEPTTMPGADVRLRFLNADGSESGACGNGTRCVASRLMEQTGAARLVMETGAGRLEAMPAEDGGYTVNMGPAWLDWQEIPLAEEADTLHLDIALGPLTDPAAVNMGNPHCIFFVDDAEDIELSTLGPQIEHHPLFPERTNVEVATVIDRGRIRLRVWERGAGITLACGSGACATVVAAVCRGLGDRRVELIMDGGSLTAEWAENGDVFLTGPVATSFSGTLEDYSAA